MRTTITHEFVEAIPDRLDDGIVYISIPYTTAVHRCCCGCGHEVVTPLHPLQWSVTFNGEVISLTPSIGNWSFPCKAHYWIRAGRVHQARTFTAPEIAKIRTKDQAPIREHYEPRTDATQAEEADATRNWWTRPMRWLRRRSS